MYINLYDVSILSLSWILYVNALKIRQQFILLISRYLLIGTKNSRDRHLHFKNSVLFRNVHKCLLYAYVKFIPVLAKFHSFSEKVIKNKSLENRN